MTQQGFHLSLRLYRWLLLAYPCGFRDLYGADMLLDFEDLYHDALADTSRWGVVGFWVNTLLDLITSAIQERMRQVPYRKRPITMNNDTTVFNNQLASTLDFWSRLMRGGYSVKQVLELAAKHAPEPTASVAQATLDDANTSGDFIGAIARMPHRMDSPYLQQVVDMLLKQFETGGNLADKMDALNDSIREEISGDNWSMDYNYDDGNEEE